MRETLAVGLGGSLPAGPSTTSPLSVTIVSGAYLVDADREGAAGSAPFAVSALAVPLSPAPIS